MKTILGACMLCVLIASPALSELTQEDLDKIRLLIHQENKAIKAEIANVKAEIANVKNEVSWIRGRIEGMEKRFDSVDKRFDNVDKRFDNVDKRFDSVDKQITHTANLSYGLIALIVAAVGIPQIIMVWRSRRDSTLERRIEELVRQNLKITEDIETLKQQRIVRS